MFKASQWSARHQFHVLRGNYDNHNRDEKSSSSVCPEIPEADECLVEGNWREQEKTTVDALKASEMRKHSLETLQKFRTEILMKHL